MLDAFLKVDRVEVTHSTVEGQGFVRNHSLLVLERGDSAAALILDVERDVVILTEQFRLPTYEKGPGWLIEAVAGSIDVAETPEQCIRREMLEEVGYQAGDLKVIGTFYTTPGGSSERTFLFFAPVRPADLIDQAASGLAAQKENIRRVETPREDFIKGCRTGRYQDAKLLVAGLWLAAGGLDA